jgi:membrane protein
MSKLKHLLQRCKDAAVAWVDDLAPSMGAAIAYYTAFSLAPLLVIVIAVAGVLFARRRCRGRSPRSCPG